LPHVLFLACNPDKKSTGDSDEIAGKPKILFIFSDEQAYSAIHALGNAPFLIYVPFIPF
jgi:hypothetical protein